MLAEVLAGVATFWHHSSLLAAAQSAAVLVTSRISHCALAASTDLCQPLQWAQKFPSGKRRKDFYPPVPVEPAYFSLYGQAAGGGWVTPAFFGKASIVATIRGSHHNKGYTRWLLATEPRPRAPGRCTGKRLGWLAHQRREGDCVQGFGAAPDKANDLLCRWD